MRTATNSKGEGLPSPIGRTDTRRLAAGLAAIFAGALVGTTALAQSIQSEIQDEEQPGSEIRVPVPFGRILEPGPEPAPPPEQLGAPLAPFDGSFRPLLPPAEATFRTARMTVPTSMLRTIPTRLPMRGLPTIRQGPTTTIQSRTSDGSRQGVDAAPLADGGG